MYLEYCYQEIKSILYELAIYCPHCSQIHIGILKIHSSLRIPRLQWNTTLDGFGFFGADVFLVDHWMPHSQNWKYDSGNPPAHL